MPEPIVSILRDKPPYPDDTPWAVRWQIVFDPADDTKYDGDFGTYREAVQHVAWVLDAEAADNTDSVKQETRCPDSDPDGTGLKGCGRTFTFTIADNDGMVDCPHCGLAFDPASQNADKSPLTLDQVIDEATAMGLLDEQPDHDFAPANGDPGHCSFCGAYDSDHEGQGRT